MSDNSYVGATKGPKAFNLRLKLPGLIAIAVLLLGGFVWIFILGIMVGRKQLEAENSALSAMVPAASLRQNTSDKPQEQGDEGTEGLNQLFNDNSLVQSEDLEFKEELRAPVSSAPAVAPRAGSIAGGTPAPAPTARTPQPPAREQDAAIRPRAVQPAPVQPAAQAAGPSVPDAAGETAGRPAGGESVYNHTYQVASFTQLDQAEAMIRRLSGGGVPSELEISRAGNVTRYRVLVNFKGTPEQVSEFIGQLKTFRLGEPLLRKRTRAE